MSTDTIADSLGFTDLTPEQRDGNLNTAPLGARTEEVTTTSQEVHDAARGDLDFLAGLAMPEVFQFLFPPVLRAVWDWLLSFTEKHRIFPQLALGLPRGFAKTTVVKLYVLFCILFTNKKFILIISSSATLAQNIVADVIDMLDQPNIKSVFGDWRVGIEIDRQDLKKFGFRGRNLVLAGIGAGTSLRGLNIKNERPDVMIFEDIQTREQAQSKVQSLELESWMLSTAMKAKSPFGCMFIFVANMYPTEWSILRKLKKNPSWVKFIAGGILASGESLWEELHPIEQLLAEFNNDLLAGHPEIFYSEVLNDENASVNNLIDISKLPSYPFELDDISAGNFILIDPATDKANSDATSIGLFEIHNATPCLTKLTEGRLSPGDTIREAVKMALNNNCRLIAVESNAYQYTLKYWFDVIIQQMGIVGMEVVEVYSGSYSKNSRILQMFKTLQAGELFYSRDVAPQVNLQISHFNPLKGNNTDGILDLLTYAPKVLELYGASIASSSVIDAQEWSAVSVVPFNSAF